MPIKLFSSVVNSVILITIITIDYFLGNGIVEFLQKILCKLTCFIRKSIREEAQAQLEIKSDGTVSLSALITEIILLALTLVLLNKYKQFRCKDRIDGLLQESREALRQTNEFLEKWRLRRMNTMNLPDEYTYLDEEPQEIRPYKLEVPILHMAIIDTLGTARNQPESGDAGDRTTYTDSALLTMTSLLDEDFGSTIDETTDERLDSKAARNRVLWDVQEEEYNLDD